MEWMLAVETSTRYGGVALFKGNEALQTRAVGPDKPASEYLIPYMRDMLNACSVPLADIASFAVSIGPGSFTGLRVGLSAVKTLARHLDKPVFPVPTLYALAMAAGQKSCPVAVVMDARKGEIFGAYFSTEGPVRRLCEDVVMPIEKFLAQSGSEKLFMIGDGIDAYRDEIEKSPIQVTYAASDICHPSPEFTGLSVFTGYVQPVTGDDIFKLAPVYLRKSEAEIKWEKTFGLQFH
jgi:tRNA threonylcarbamoyladenosine biosynthesis protein TsaB